MKHSLNKAHLYGGEIVEFNSADYHAGSKLFVPKDSKARFVRWVDNDNHGRMAEVIPLVEGIACSMTVLPSILSITINSDY